MLPTKAPNDAPYVNRRRPDIGDVTLEVRSRLSHGRITIFVNP